MTTPATGSGNKSILESERRWESSAAYRDMLDALAEFGWADYATANAEKFAHPARYRGFHESWQLRMQQRVGINPKSPANPNHQNVRSSSSPNAVRVRASRSRRRGAE